MQNKKYPETPYDIDGKTVSPFYMMDNKRMKFANVDGSQSTGSQVLKLAEEHRVISPTSIPDKEFRTKDIKEQMRLTKIESPWNQKFWSQWSLI